MPVETVHMENLSLAGTLRDIKVLIMSYANMKPLPPDVHTHLSAWGKNGDVLTPQNFSYRIRLLKNEKQSVKIKSETPESNSVVRRYK